MKPYLFFVIAMFVVIISFASTSAAAVIVFDGDTISIDGEKIRLFGVDAPEHNQPGGAEARSWLAAEVARAGSTLRIERRGAPDRYGRTIAILFAGRKSLNLALVANGHAWAYREYASTYIGAEERARKAELGLWAFPCPVPPWHHRHN